MAAKSLMQNLAHDPVLGHITTFGGHPVCCAAASATFDIVKGLNTHVRIPTLEEVVRKNLVHPAIRGISGKGLLLAVEFESEEFARRVISRCIETGIITDWFLFAAHKLRLCPPLTITTDELEAACGIIVTAIDDVWNTEPTSNPCMQSSSVRSTFASLQCPKKPYSTKNHERTDCRR